MLRTIGIPSAAEVQFGVALVLASYGLAELVRYGLGDALWALVLSCSLFLGLLLRPMYSQFSENRTKDHKKIEKYRLFG